MFNVSKVDKKLHRKIALQGKLKELTIEESELNESFTFMATDIDFAKGFLLTPNMLRSLLEARDFLKRLSLSQQESWIYLIAELNEESLRPLLNLIISCGQALTNSRNYVF